MQEAGDGRLAEAHFRRTEGLARRAEAVDAARGDAPPEAEAPSSRPTPGDGGEEAHGADEARTSAEAEDVDEALCVVPGGGASMAKEEEEEHSAAAVAEAASGPSWMGIERQTCCSRVSESNSLSRRP